MEAILDRAVSTLASTLDVEFAKVLELLPDRRGFLLKAGVGWRPGLVGTAVVGAGLDSQAGYALVSNGPVIAHDLRTETRFNDPALLREHDVVSGMSVIIATHSHGPYGVLGAHTARLRAFTQDDIHFLQAIADILGLAIDRDRAYRQLTVYREVFQNSVEGIAIIHPDGRYVEQNAANARMFGYPDGELVGRTPAVHLGEETFAHMHNALRERGRFAGEAVGTRKDGRQLDVEVSAFSIRDEHGGPLYYVCIQRDITQRKRGMRALARSETRHRHLVESAPLGIAVHRNRRVIYINPFGAQLLGAASPEEVVGASVMDFVHPDYQEALRLAARRARESQAPTDPIEVKLMARDGRVLDVEMVFVPFEDDDGPAIQVLARDITEQKLADERVRLLVEISDVLNQSMDYERTLGDVAQLAVRKLADWAAVDILQPDGSLERVAIAHRDPRKVERVRDVLRWYPPGAIAPLLDVVRTREPILVRDISPSDFEAAGLDSEHIAELRQIGLRSAMLVPLEARGQVFGVVSFVNAESGRRFDRSDLEVAKALTVRCAVAIDNARLYREAEKQRRAAEEFTERLQFILRSAQVGTWEWDRASGNLVWSNTMEELHGHPAGSFDGMFEAFQADIHPDDLPRVLAQTGQALEHGTDYEMEYRVVGAFGVRWIMAKGTVVHDGAGRATGMTGVCTDITSRKHAEERLREERERLQTLIQVSPIGVLILEAENGRILLTNPEANRIARIPLRTGDLLWEALEGVTFRRQDGAPFQPDDLPFSRAARTGEHVRAERMTIEFPDGQLQPVLASAAPLYGPSGEVTEVVVLLQDIRSLTENERLRNEFLGMVTHELRSPLVVIKSASAIAKEEALVSAPESVELLDAIDEQADRMLSLVANLLDMAQIEAGAFSIDPHPANIRQVLESPIANMASVSPVPIVLQVPEDIPHLALDSQRIGQVVTNLLSNAVRFADPGTSIEVFVEDTPEGVVVAVRNQGPPIPPEKQPLLFRKFTRISSGDGPRAGGAGLGLSICKAIVEAHRGTIWAESSPVSKQTTFYFRLPKDGGGQPPERQPRRSHGEDAPTSGPREGQDKPYRILAVDDEPMVLRYVQNLLRRSGYEVIGVTGGYEAIQKVREEEPDLVLLDLMMPEISGFEVLEKIREFSDVAVIFLSASNRDEDKVQGLNLGADDYISKPFSTMELSARIAATLRRQRKDNR